MNEPNLNSAQLDPSTEQLIHRLVSSLLAPAQKGECRCHWIDPQKTPILVWKSPKDPNTLVMKIAQQKLIGLARADKNNELYWKFREFQEGGVETPIPPKPSRTTEPTVSLPSAENTAKVELSQNQSATEKEIGESEAVKKFRAKYGNPNTQEPTGEQ